MIQFPDGSRTLRAKIDMQHINMLMRDPILYRIKHAHHHRTGDKWCIYPMYDFAHGQSDSIEEVTHSICTMEFVPHRELYDWLIKSLEIYPSHQYEFARRNINYTVTSKRKLLQLVTEKQECQPSVDCDAVVTHQKASVTFAIGQEWPREIIWQMQACLSFACGKI